MKFSVIIVFCSPIIASGSLKDMEIGVLFIRCICDKNLVVAVMPTALQKDRRLGKELSTLYPRRTLCSRARKR